MCISPRTIYREEGGQYAAYSVACRHCWQCTNNRVWDWVGRAIAENETCTKAFFVTLTYGHTDRYGESLDSRARSLTYSDVQKWLKRIRAKYNVRYMVTGEYGDRKGRAHWHAILFFYGDYPQMKVRFHYWGTNEYNTDPFWSNGHTWWDDFTPQNAKYVCKYMLKAKEGSGIHQTMAMLSKKPTLGDAYFRKRAEKYVEQGLSPQDLTYYFPEVKWGKKNPKPRTYVLRGVTAENFLTHYMETWRAKHGNDNWPYSEILEDSLDREASPRVEAYAMERLTQRPERKKQSLEKPWYVPREQFPSEKYGIWAYAACHLSVDKRYNLWKVVDRSIGRPNALYWSYDQKGFVGWQEVPNLVTAAKAQALREEFASREMSSEPYFLSPAARAKADGWHKRSLIRETG